MPGLPVLCHLPEFAQVLVHYIIDAIQPSHPLSPSSPSAFNLAQHQDLFRWVVCSHQVTKVSLQHQSFKWVFRIDLLAVQGILKGLLQQFKSTNFSCYVFFIDCLALTAVQDYWKDHNLAYTDFSCKMMSFLFNTLSRFVIAFLPWSNCLLILWLQSPFTVVLETKRRKSVTASNFFPSICH